MNGDHGENGNRDDGGNGITQRRRATEILFVFVCLPVCVSVAPFLCEIPLPPSAKFPLIPSAPLPFGPLRRRFLDVIDHQHVNRSCP